MTYCARIDRNYGQRDGFSVWLYRFSGDGPGEFVAPMGDPNFKPTKNEWDLPPPSMVLKQEMLVALAKALVESGHIPKEAFSSADELKATRAHLEDLRKVAFNELDIKG